MPDDVTLMSRAYMVEEPTPTGCPLRSIHTLCHICLTSPQMNVKTCALYYLPNLYKTNFI